MPRSSWRAIIAAFGWLTLAAASPERENPSSQRRETEQQIANALQGIDASLQKANEHGERDQPCRQGQDNSRSDLCAQWTAANSAQRSATWTERTFYLGTGGILIGLLTLGAAIAAAKFARDAARETKRSADAAHEANRPWAEALPEDLAFAWGSTDGGELTLMAKMVNHGNSPATNVVIRVLLAVVPRAQQDCPTPIADMLTTELESVENRKERGGRALFPGEPDPQKRVAIVSPEDIAAARNTPEGKLRFLFAIGVTYCFGGRIGRTVKTYVLTIGEDIDWDAPASNVVKGDKLRLTDRFKGYAT